MIEQSEFLAKVVELAGVKVGYAVERNIPLVLDDIKRQRELFGDADEPGADRIEMTVKVSVIRPSEYYARLEIDSVTWETKVKRKDNDFEPGEVDSNEPFLPGMADGKKPKGDADDADDRPPVNPREKAILEVAAELGVHALRTCRQKNTPLDDRIIEKWDGKAWQQTLCESVEARTAAGKAASDMGNLYIDGDYLDEDSIATLRAAGYTVTAGRTAGEGAFYIDAKIYGGE